MSSGSIQQVLVCVPVNTATTSVQQQVCPRVGGQYYKPQPTQAYLLNPDSQQQIDAALEPFDYAYAAGLWSLAFSTVVALYFASYGIALVLGFIRRA
jgi:hypothetical protein